MRFGVFYEHQLPRPWDGDAEERLLQDALDQVELADQLGYDAVWEVEHWVIQRPNGKDILAEFDSLASVEKAA